MFSPQLVDANKVSEIFNNEHIEKLKVVESRREKITITGPTNCLETAPKVVFF